MTWATGGHCKTKLLAGADVLCILTGNGMQKAGRSGRAELWVCGRSLFGVAGSNLVGGI